LAMLTATVVAMNHGVLEQPLAQGKHATYRWRALATIIPLRLRLRLEADHPTIQRAWGSHVGEVGGLSRVKTTDRLLGGCDKAL